MDENEPQLSGFVRADTLQRHTPRRRMRARLNIRAAKMADPVEAWLHGLDQTIGSSSGGRLFDEFDDGGAVRIKKTAAGNWSSDGNDTAPVTGLWIYLERLATTAATDIPAGGDDGTDEFDTEGEFVSADLTTEYWEITLWDDGAVDVDFAWRSETLDASLAEDIFMFREWSPVPDLSVPDTWEDEAVETVSTVWLEPIEPPPPLPSIFDLGGLQVVSDSPITDAGMTALGFTDQIEVSDGVDTWYLPVSDTPWS